MSVHVTAYVWEHSQHKGTELLLMLAIADIAHKNGIAFPSVKTLAGYIRMSPRNTQRVLAKCEASGELEIKQNAGPHGTHVFRIRMNTTLPLFNPHEGGDKLTGDKLTGDIQAHGGVTKTQKRGDTAMSPEPKTNQNLNRIAGGASPTPVAACFRAYADGIKTKYGAEYPPSAKANGQLSQVVARVGRDAALAVTQFYITSSNPWYVKVRHSLDYLVRDCERLWMDVQIANGGGAVKPATHARVALLNAEGKIVCDLGEQPLGGPEEVAKRVMRDYANRISRIQPRYIEVRLGAERRVFSVEELSGVPA
jgi:hypothetical protein